MTTLLRYATFLTLLFSCAQVFAASEMIVEVYELRHTDSEAVLPVVRSFLDDGETAEGFESRLIIKALPENHKKIGRMVKRIDIAKPALMVEVKQMSSGMTNALRAGASSPESVRFSTHLGNARNSVIQHIMVQDGEEAFVVHGEDIPYASELSMVHGSEQGFYRQTDYQKTRTGFRIRPTLRGDTVDVEIVPFREKARKQLNTNVDNPPVIDYQEAATRIRVPLNSWFDVGGTSSTREQDEYGTIRWSSGRNVRDDRILIRIQAPSANPEK